MELLRQLQEKGFEIVLGEGNRVGIRPADRLTPELADRIRAHKPELIKALRKHRQADQYDKPKYPPKPQDRCRACGEYDYWLSRYGLWVCRVCHPPAPGAEVNLETYHLIEQASNTNPEPSKGTDTRRWCEGYKPPRFVHPEVCQWHLEEADPKCVNCKHLSKEDRERWMDAYLDKAIGRLNARGAIYYSPDDSKARRQRIYDLEKRITQTFLIGDVKNFIEAVRCWQHCFRGQRKCLSK